MRLDTAKNAYITGATYSIDFPIASATYANNSGQYDAFVTKINGSGTSILYSTFLGGSDTDSGIGIDVDRTGNVYITGRTWSVDFPRYYPLYASNAGECDVFITKLDASGNLVYSTYLGGSGSDFGNGIAADTSGNAYIIGQTRSTNFPTAAAIYGSYMGGTFVGDTFVTKLSNSGTSLIYSTYLGGSNDEAGKGIAVDVSGSTYVTGWTFSNDFPRASAFDGTFSECSLLPGGDAFITKINGSGASLAYSTYLEGSGDDVSEEIAVDGHLQAYVTGHTYSTDFPTATAYYANNAGWGDVFVIKLNSSGNSLVFSTYLGGSGDDEGLGIAVDASEYALCSRIPHSNASICSMAMIANGAACIKA